MIGLTKSLGKELAKTRRPRQLRDAGGGPHGDLRPDDRSSTSISCCRRFRWAASARSTKSRRSSAGSRARSARSRPARCSTFPAAARRTDPTAWSRRGYATARGYSRTASMILPMCCEDSINACAAAASASGNTRWTTGFTTPPSSSGQTFARSEFAIAALRSRRARAQGRAGDGQPLHHDVTPIDFGTATMQERDRSTSRPSSARLRRFFSM